MQFEIIALDVEKNVEVRSCFTIDSEPSSRVFDSHNPNFSSTREINELFLRSVRDHSYMVLHARGHLFLNDVFDMLGFSRTAGGAVLGWTAEDYSSILFEWSEHDESLELKFHPEGCILDHDSLSLSHSHIFKESRP